MPWLGTYFGDEPRQQGVQTCCRYACTDTQANTLTPTRCLSKEQRDVLSAITGVCPHPELEGQRALQPWNYLSYRNASLKHWSKSVPVGVVKIWVLQTKVKLCSLHCRMLLLFFIYLNKNICFSWELGNPTSALGGLAVLLNRCSCFLSTSER